MEASLGVGRLEAFGGAAWRQCACPRGAPSLLWGGGPLLVAPDVAAAFSPKAAAPLLSVAAVGAPGLVVYSPRRPSVHVSPVRHLRRRCRSRSRVRLGWAATILPALVDPHGVLWAIVFSGRRRRPASPSSPRVIVLVAPPAHAPACLGGRPPSLSPSPSLPLGRSLVLYDLMLIFICSRAMNCTLYFHLASKFRAFWGGDCLELALGLGKSLARPLSSRQREQHLSKIGHSSCNFYGLDHLNSSTKH